MFTIIKPHQADKLKRLTKFTAIVDEVITKQKTLMKKYFLQKSS